MQDSKEKLTFLPLLDCFEKAAFPKIDTLSAFSKFGK